MKGKKFRAWDGEKMLPHGSFNIHISQDWMRLGTTDGGVVFLGEDSEGTLLEGMGQNDKNGQEIYDRDIVRDGDNIGIVRMEVQDFHAEGEYRFEKLLMCHIELVGDFDPLDQFNLFNCAKYSRWEVIGNIFENPELLEKVA